VKVTVGELMLVAILVVLLVAMFSDAGLG